jgi:hypothetical protein
MHPEPTHRQRALYFWPSLTRLLTWVESGIWRGQAERGRVCEASAACGARTRFSLQPGVFSRARRVYAPHGVKTDLDRADGHDDAESQEEQAAVGGQVGAPPTTGLVRRGACARDPAGGLVACVCSRSFSRRPPAGRPDGRSRRQAGYSAERTAEDLLAARVDRDERSGRDLREIGVVDVVSHFCAVEYTVHVDQPNLCHAVSCKPAQLEKRD